ASPFAPRWLLGSPRWCSTTRGVVLLPSTYRTFLTHSIRPGTSKAALALASALHMGLLPSTAARSISRARLATAPRSLCASQWRWPPAGCPLWSTLHDVEVYARLLPGVLGPPLAGAVRANAVIQAPYHLCAFAQLPDIGRKRPYKIGGPADVE